MKKAIILLITLLYVTLLSGCGTTQYSPETDIEEDAVKSTEESVEEFRGMKRLGEQKENVLHSGLAATFYEYEDTVTGVHYLIFMSSRGISMCPRYNADGTIYVSEESE